MQDHEKNSVIAVIWGMVISSTPIGVSRLALFDILCCSLWKGNRDVNNRMHNVQSPPYINSVGQSQYVFVNLIINVASKYVHLHTTHIYACNCDLMFHQQFSYSLLCIVSQFFDILLILITKDV